MTRWGGSGGGSARLRGSGGGRARTDSYTHGLSTHKMSRSPFPHTWSCRFAPCHQSQSLVHSPPLTCESDLTSSKSPTSLSVGVCKSPLLLPTPCPKNCDIYNILFPPSPHPTSAGWYNKIRRCRNSDVWSKLGWSCSNFNAGLKRLLAADFCSCY